MTAGAAATPPNEPTASKNARHFLKCKKIPRLAARNIGDFIQSTVSLPLMITVLVAGDQMNFPLFGIFHWFYTPKYSNCASIVPLALMCFSYKTCCGVEHWTVGIRCNVTAGAAATPPNEPTASFAGLYSAFQSSGLELDSLEEIVDAYSTSIGSQEPTNPQKNPLSGFVQAH